MYGLLVTVGSAARKFSQAGLPRIWPAKSSGAVISPRPDIRVAHFTPSDIHATSRFVWSDDRKVAALVDGYLYTRTAPRQASLREQSRSFANTCRKEGYEAAIRSIAGGTFNLAVVDLLRLRCHVTTDHIGSLPLYHSPVAGGWVLSTNPVALAMSRIIDAEPDMTAMAEWAYIGYTIGDRFMLKGIRIVPPYTSFHWNAEAAEGHFEENPDSPWHILPDACGPSPEMLTEAFEESCRRIAILEPRPVNLQSAGKDSRFILASWPKGYNPPCYTYGDIDSHEVAIARSVARKRGSRWIHVWLDGDDVTPELAELFAHTGLITFPDRLLAARRVRRDGYDGILDGYLGGVFNGHGYLDCDRYFSLLARLARYVTVFVDQRASKIGRDLIAEAILDSILEVRTDEELRQYIHEGFVEQLRTERPNMLNDIRIQVDRFMPANDSLAALWNNLVLANRSAHAIVQQKAIVRSFVDVYCPFSGDVEFHKLQRRIPHAAAAHDRFYIRMYRQSHPDYGKIPYGATLISLTRPPVLHKWSSILLSKGLYIPLLTGKADGRERDANSWNRWLRESREMREAGLCLLREGGILDERNGRATSDAVESGNAKGSGKLFHLAGIAKWLAQSGRVTA
jgi:hypothetical protein